MISHHYIIIIILIRKNRGKETAKLFINGSFFSHCLPPHRSTQSEIIFSFSFSFFFYLRESCEQGLLNGKMKATRAKKVQVILPEKKNMWVLSEIASHPITDSYLLVMQEEKSKDKQNFFSLCLWWFLASERLLTICLDDAVTFLFSFNAYDDYVNRISEE